MNKDTASELDKLEVAMTAFLRTIKKPEYWEQFKQRAEISIDRPAATILKILSEHDCQFQELVQLLGIEAPAVSRKVHQLEDQGLIIRQPTTDRRVHKLRLSKQAVNITARLTMAKRSFLSEVLSNWTSQEKQQLVILLDKLALDMATVLKTQAEKVN